MDQPHNVADALEVLGITATSVGALVAFYQEAKRNPAISSTLTVPVILTGAGTVLAFAAIAGVYLGL